MISFLCGEQYSKLQKLFETLFLITQQVNRLSHVNKIIQV